MKLYKEYDLEVIKVGHKLLMTSCRKAVERGRVGKGVYKDVRCSFSSPKKFRNSLRGNIKFMRKWLDYTVIYIENDKNIRYRPVLDRIDEKGHYHLPNIQPLSFSENSSKAQTSKVKKGKSKALTGH